MAVTQACVNLSYGPRGLDLLAQGLSAAEVDDHPTPIQELQRLLELHRLYFGQSDEAQLLPLEEELTREVQALLRGLHFYRGPIHGVYDEATQRALADWAGMENLEERLRGDACMDPVCWSSYGRRGEVSLP